MTSNRIPSTQSKQEKEGAAHIETDEEMRSRNSDKDGKRSEKTMDEKVKLENELEDKDQTGR